MTVEDLRIGISLSGGGARGAAHVGVLQALKENGIEPGFVAGASAGAIVGALYAAGKSSEEMLDFIKQSSVYKLFKVGLPSMGLTKLSYLRERLSEALEVDRFEELDKKLFVAITNLCSGQLEVRDSGPLIDVIVASSSIPLVFRPIDIDGNWYADGGLLSNLPVLPLIPVSDFIIGVNIMPQIPVDPKSLESVVGIAARCFDLSIHANTRPSAALCHVVIEPEEITNFNIFQLNRYQPMYEAGYQTALSRIDEIREKMAAKAAELSEKAEANQNQE